MRTSFKNIPIGKFFMFGQTTWRKQSSRTARVIASNSKSWYYFSQKDVVTPISDPTEPFEAVRFY